MSAFPKLKTGAVAQYPARRVTQFSTHVIRFLDGTEQRFRDQKAGRRRWIIRLELLDEGELASLESFFLGNQGQFGNFEFVDPWDGVTYPSCSVEDGQLNIIRSGYGRGETTIVVKQNEE